MKYLIILSVVALSITSCQTEEKLIVNKIPDRPAYMRQSSPGNDYVWLEGDFVIKNGEYRWRKGHWAKSKNKTWVEGDWAYSGRGWYWKKGHWR